MDAFLQYITSQLRYTLFTFMWLYQTGLTVLRLTVRQQSLAIGRFRKQLMGTGECSPRRDVTDRLTSATVLVLTGFVGENFGGWHDASDRVSCLVHQLRRSPVRYCRMDPLP